MGVGGAFLCFLSCPLTIVFTTKITHLPVNGFLSSVTLKFLLDSPGSLRCLEWEEGGPFSGLRTEGQESCLLALGFEAQRAWPERKMAFHWAHGNIPGNQTSDTPLRVRGQTLGGSAGSGSADISPTPNPPGAGFVEGPGQQLWFEGG